MFYRLQIALVFLTPIIVLGVVYALGQAVPLPVLGREYVLRIVLPEAGQALDLPQIEGPEDPARPLIVIDAGHGGHDPGALGQDYQEKALTLGLARSLRSALLDQGGVRVALTRDDDRFLALAERVAIARALDGDLFISIHADSAGQQNDVRGASIYTLSSEASSEAAARFAARENQADQINGIVLSGQGENISAILVELSQRRTSDASAQFAQLIVREGEGQIRFHPQPLRSAELGVLRAPDIPSVLFEAGFITNPSEARLLASAEGQGAFAEALGQAIRVQFARESLED